MLIAGHPMNYTYLMVLFPSSNGTHLTDPDGHLVTFVQPDDPWAYRCRINENRQRTVPLWEECLLEGFVTAGIRLSDPCILEYWLQNMTINYVRSMAAGPAV
jgi:hypothetical protein